MQENVVFLVIICGKINGHQRTFDIGGLGLSLTVNIKDQGSADFIDENLVDFLTSTKLDEQKLGELHVSGLEKALSRSTYATNNAAGLDLYSDTTESFLAYLSSLGWHRDDSSHLLYSPDFKFILKIKGCKIIDGQTQIEVSSEFEKVLRKQQDGTLSYFLGAKQMDLFGDIQDFEHCTVIVCFYMLVGSGLRYGLGIPRIPSQGDIKKIDDWVALKWFNPLKQYGPKLVFGDEDLQCGAEWSGPVVKG